MLAELLVRARSAVPRHKPTPVANRFHDAFLNFFDPSMRGKSGFPVSEARAWNASCFYGGILIIADAFAATPMHLYERTEGDDRKRATDHYLYPIVREALNREQSAFTFYHGSMVHNLAWGNSYAEIARDAKGRVEALWPLLPNRVNVRRTRAGERLRVVAWNGRTMTAPAERIIYEISTDDPGRKILLDSDRVFHVPGMGFDGLRGFSLLTIARGSLGLSLGSADFMKAFYENNAVPAGVFQTPQGTEKTMAAQFKAKWDEEHEGAENAHKNVVLPGGWEFKAMSISPHDALMLDVARFSTEEWARWLNVPIHFLKDLTNAGTRANVVQETLTFAQHTIRPWLIRFEQEMNRKLLTVVERPRFYFEGLWQAIVQFDLLTRFKAYREAINAGIMSTNDVRRKENMNGIGPQGDMFRWPLAMAPAQTVADGTVVPGAKNQKQQREDKSANETTKSAIAPAVPIFARALDNGERMTIVRGHIDMMTDAFERLMCMETKGLLKLLKSHAADSDLRAIGEGTFLGEAEAFYEGKMEFITSTLAPIVRSIETCIRVSLAADSPRSAPLDVGRIAHRHCDLQLSALRLRDWTGWPKVGVDADAGRGLPAAVAAYELARCYHSALVAQCRALSLRLHWVMSDRCVGVHEPGQTKDDGVFDRHPPVDETCECHLELTTEEPR